jgi:hypothetical protein
MGARHARLWWGGLILVSVATVLTGCKRYPQDTPEAVLTAAKTMIADKRADRLPDLIYAESPDMRKLLDQVGQMLDSLQNLGYAVKDAYPKEIEKLNNDAAEAAKSGQASSHIQQLLGQVTTGMQGMGGGRRRGGPPMMQGDPDALRKTFDKAIQELFADPYGWLASSEARLTVQTISDDQAALMWDGKPVFGVGILMVKQDGKWYIQLPTTFPGAGSILPKSAEGWEILGGLFQVFDNAFYDLTKDVKSGKAPRLEDLAARAGDKMFIPAAMVVFAYAKLAEDERRAARAANPGAPRPGVRLNVGPATKGDGQGGVSVEIGTTPPAPK